MSPQKPLSTMSLHSPSAEPRTRPHNAPLESRQRSENPKKYFQTFFHQKSHIFTYVRMQTKVFIKKKKKIKKFWKSANFYFWASEGVIGEPVRAPATWGHICRARIQGLEKPHHRPQNPKKNFQTFFHQKLPIFTYARMQTKVLIKKRKTLKNSENRNFLTKRSRFRSFEGSSNALKRGF